MSIQVRVTAAVSRYGTYRDSGENERQFSGRNKLTWGHSCCAIILNVFVLKIEFKSGWGAQPVLGQVQYFLSRLDSAIICS